MSETRIYAATPAEAGEISRLASRIWRQVYPGIISTGQIEYMLEWMYAPEKIRSDIEEIGITYLWIESNGARRGYAAFGPDQEEEGTWLHKLYLEPELHRRGIGSAALVEIEKQVSRSGKGELWLRVNRANESAIAAYLANGFEIREERCSEIGNGFVMDDFIMVKTW